MEKIKSYFLTQCRAASTWYGLIGLALLLLGFNAFWIFIALVLIPDNVISGWLQKLTTKGADAMEDGISTLEDGIGSMAANVKKSPDVTDVDVEANESVKN